jgi:hypothetical protein
MAPRSEPTFRRAPFAILAGIASGALIELPALLAAVMSAGAGYGHYAAARILFPFSMLLTLVEGSIGPFSLSIGLIQFPLYGALLGWSMRRKSYRAAILVALLHLVAVTACFTGLLPYFS